MFEVDACAEAAESSVDVADVDGVAGTGVELVSFAAGKPRVCRELLELVREPIEMASLPFCALNEFEVELFRSRRRWSAASCRFKS